MTVRQTHVNFCLSDQRFSEKLSCARCKEFDIWQATGRQHNCCTQVLHILPHLFTCLGRAVKQLTTQGSQSLTDPELAYLLIKSVAAGFDPQPVPHCQPVLSDTVYARRAPGVADC